MMIYRSTFLLLTSLATWSMAPGFIKIGMADMIALQPLPQRLRLPSVIAAAPPISGAVLAQATPAVPPPAAPAVGDPPLLDVGSRGPNVIGLQQALQALGYYTEAIDGVYGPATQKAVADLQRNVGLDATGSLDRVTLQVLQSAQASPANAALNAPQTAPPGINEGANPIAPMTEEVPSPMTTAEAGTSADGTTLPPAESATSAVASTSEVVADGATTGETEPAANVPPAEAPDAAASTSSQQDPGFLWLGLGFLALLILGGGLTFLAYWLARSNKAKNSLQASVFPLPEPISAHLPGRSRPGTDGIHSSLGTNNGLIPSDHPAASSSSPPIALNETTRLPRVNIIDELIQDLRNPDPVLRAKAIWELGQRGDSNAVQPLVDAMIDGDSQERSLVLSALSEIGIRTLRPTNRALALSLQDDNAEVRKNAIRDLTRIYDLMVQVSQMLSRAAQDNDDEVRETAVWALQQLNRLRQPPGGEDLPSLHQAPDMPELKEDVRSSKVHPPSETP